MLKWWLLVFILFLKWFIRERIRSVLDSWYRRQNAYTIVFHMYNLCERIWRGSIFVPGRLLLTSSFDWIPKHPWTSHQPKLLLASHSTTGKENNLSIANITTDSYINVRVQEITKYIRLTTSYSRLIRVRG